MLSIWSGLWQIKRFSKKKTELDKFLRDKAFKILSDPKYGGYQRGLPSMVYKFFDKKSSISGIAATEPNYQLASEFHNQIIRKSERKKKFIHHLETIFGALI